MDKSYKAEDKTKNHMELKKIESCGISSEDIRNIVIGRLSDYSTKAEIYIISLTFSIFALSIQFPVESTDLLPLRLQAAGWGFLFFSFLFWNLRT